DPGLGEHGVPGCPSPSVYTEVGYSVRPHGDGTTLEAPAAGPCPREPRSSGPQRLAGPDVGAAHLAVDAGRRLGRVNLELRVRKTRVRQGCAVVVDRDRARDTAGPRVQ